MKFLVLGSGGREHTFAWKLKQSELCDKVYIAPGNAGSKEVGQNVNIAVDDFEGIASFCLDHNIDCVVVGPEVPLVKGIYDYFKERVDLKSVKVIGPSKNGAQLEGSKNFAKEFMIRHNIPTAAYNKFTKENLEEGIAFIESNSAPYVLKADGLAAGKGVVIVSDKNEAKQELRAMIADAKFGTASTTVIIEEFLDGIEFSVFALTDGTNYVLLPNAKDYKRIGEGDIGLNTGGMGAISPVPFVTDVLMDTVKNQIIDPTIQGFIKDNIEYKGFVYFGLILVDGKPKVIEYNCRMGDPETEIVLPRLKSDLAELFVHCANGTLNEAKTIFSEFSGATVVLVSGGYPESYEKGKPIRLPEESNSIVFHAGTTEKEGNLLTNGGRVLAISSLGSTLEEALKNSNATANEIQFEGKYFRRDIGHEFTK